MLVWARAEQNCHANRKIVERDMGTDQQYKRVKSEITYWEKDQGHTGMKKETGQQRELKNRVTKLSKNRTNTVNRVGRKEKC